MKTRDSGMPERDWWESFFEPDAIFDALGLVEIHGTAVDVGCGYGTFTLALARRSRHPVIGIDIEPDMVALTRQRAEQAGLGQVQTQQVDITEAGMGLAAGAVDLILVFNLLHCEQPQALLAELTASLRPGGRVAAIHWRRDVPTPRGPDLSIRPSPEDMRRMLSAAGLTIIRQPMLLPPYHVGLVGMKPATQ